MWQFASVDLGECCEYTWHGFRLCLVMLTPIECPIAGFQCWGRFCCKAEYSGTWALICLCCYLIYVKATSLLNGGPTELPTDSDRLVGCTLPGNRHLHSSLIYNSLFYGSNLYELDTSSLVCHIIYSFLTHFVRKSLKCMLHSSTLLRCFASFLTEHNLLIHCSGIVCTVYVSWMSWIPEY